MTMRWLRGIGLAAFAFVFLGACTGPAGPALAGLLGAGAMFGGEAFIKRAEADVAAKYRWRFKKQEYVTEYTSGLLAEARELRSKGDFKGWRTTMDILLRFHDSQHPETLIMEIRRRTAERSEVKSQPLDPPGTDTLMQ